jgi:hypothetical protein
MGWGQMGVDRLPISTAGAAGGVAIILENTCRGMNGMPPIRLIIFIPFGVTKTSE